MKKYLAAVVITLFTMTIQAQNIASSTLAWRIDACFSINDGITSDSEDQLVSYGNERIEWRDRTSNLKGTFEIIEVNGLWTNVAKNGAMLYEVRSEGRQGTIQFGRVNGIASVQIVLLKPEGNPDSYRLSVSTVTIP